MREQTVNEKYGRVPNEGEPAHDNMKTLCGEERPEERISC